MFCEGVERLISSGVAPKDVGFQMRFSKQELRKCIAEYPAKEARLHAHVMLAALFLCSCWMYHPHRLTISQIKHAVAEMHKRVMRQLSDEVGLHSLAWGKIQDEFIHLVSSFAALITKCYADPGLHLGFTVADVQAFFDAVQNKK